MNLQKTNQWKGATSELFNKTTTVLTKFSPFGAGIDHEAIKEKAYEWVDEIKTPSEIFTNPYVPADLRKTQTRTIRSKTGKQIAGLTLAEDWTVGPDSGIKQIPLALMLAGVITTSSMSTGLTGPAMAAGIGLGLYSLAGAGFGELVVGGLLAGATTALNHAAGGSGTLLGAATFLLPAAFIYLTNYIQKRTRANALLKQSRRHAGTSGDNEAIMKRLEKQITQAIKDDAKAPFIPLAVATGKFQHKGSFESPDAGTVIGLNALDLTQHMFIMGKPGTGKSYTLRQIIKQAYLAYQKMGKEIGMLLMDGKGELANECSKILDLIVHPRNVESFCLVDGVDATKWQSIIQTINNVKFDGQNAVFDRAALELVYNAALAHILLKEMHDANPLYTAGIDFKWSYMFRYNLMSMILAPGKHVEVRGVPKYEMGKGEKLIQILMDHPNYETDPRIKQLIFSIESELSPERQEFAMKYLKTAQGYMQTVLQSESIIKWADSETTSVDILGCLRGKKIGVALPPERFGLAGALVSQLIKASVRNAIANRENDWRDDPTATELLFVQDEFQDLFAEYDDLNNIPKDRSRGCCNVVASQTVSAIYSKISNAATADYLFANFASFIALNTRDKKANELMQEQCGTVKTFKVKNPTNNAIAFTDTAKALLSKPEYDPTHPDAAMFKKFRSDIEFNIQDKQNPNNIRGITSIVSKVIDFVFTGPIGLITNSGERHIHSMSEYTKDDRQEWQKLLSDDMLNELDNAQHAVLVLKRGGIWVRDIGIMMGVDPNFDDVPLRF